MSFRIGRRDFLKASLAATAAANWPSGANAQEQAEGEIPHGTLPPTADAMILIWIPGGLSQVEYWDPKPFTPFEKGMKGSDLLSPCPSIPTAVDDISFGKGLENIASVMEKGTLLRSLYNDHEFGFDHNRAQYHIITGYPFPTGFKAPGIGAKISRILGPRDTNMPPFVVIGREILSIDTEGPENRRFINSLHGPGFYGVQHAPLLVKEPSTGISTLNAVASMKPDRLDRRQAYLQTISGMSQKELRDSNKVDEYLATINRARNMMDSSVKEVFKYRQEETSETLERYKVDHRFGESCLLARRLVERGARFVQVEYPFKTFSLFDTHSHGASTNMLLKPHIDRPIANLIRDLDDRGMLERTLVVVMTEFGRSLAKRRNASDNIAFATSNSGQVGGIFNEYTDGHNIPIEAEDMYGMHGHFPLSNNVLFFGGGFKRGYLHGKTADRHPMFPIENRESIDDLHATIYKTLGIAPDVYYKSEGRPIHVTNLGKGRPIDALLA
ncbi:MAG TPA: DUF1501 domain-containing protein [Candidatus Hydrogenedentes bacterium]|nr:DUF1501 domain-containing protein [Candidatus Hydrogenedentota bacterium]